MAFAADGVSYPSHRHTLGDAAFDDHLAEAERILADPIAALGEPPAADGTAPEVGDDFESLRWFWLPDEVRDALPT